MSESQAEVVAMIEAVSQNRGEDVARFMDSQFGAYWSDRYYRAEPDEPVPSGQATSSYVEAASIPETSGFTLLRASAKELLVKDRSLTLAQAVNKAAQLHPELVASHQQEIREIVARA